MRCHRDLRPVELRAEVECCGLRALRACALAARPLFSHCDVARKRAIPSGSPDTIEGAASSSCVRDALSMDVRVGNCRLLVVHALLSFSNVQVRLSSMGYSPQSAVDEREFPCMPQPAGIRWWIGSGFQLCHLPSNSDLDRGAWGRTPFRRTTSRTCRPRALRSSAR